jgi:hypothetical protein
VFAIAGIVAVSAMCGFGGVKLLVTGTVLLLAAAALMRRDRGTVERKAGAVDQ